MTGDTPNDKSELDKSGAAKANSNAKDGMASAMTRNRMIKRTHEDPPTEDLMAVYST